MAFYNGSARHYFSTSETSETHKRNSQAKLPLTAKFHPATLTLEKHQSYSTVFAFTTDCMR